MRPNPPTAVIRLLVLFDRVPAEVVDIVCSKPSPHVINISATEVRIRAAVGASYHERCPFRILVAEDEGPYAVSGPILDHGDTAHKGGVRAIIRHNSAVAAFIGVACAMKLLNHFDLALVWLGLRDSRFLIAVMNPDSEVVPVVPLDNGVFEH